MIVIILGLAVGAAVYLIAPLIRVILGAIFSALVG